MNAPGMLVKPIVQITGESEFNEVFMTDARVPVENRLGAEGEGWKIISGALVNERNGIAGGMRQDEALQRLIASAKRHGRAKDPQTRQQIADLAISCAISKYSGYRGMTDGLHGRLNPHLSAAMKLAGTSLAQRMSTAHLSLLGAHGQLYENHGPATDARAAAMRWLGDRAQTIAGGTSEIQKNIVAERILGLPRA
jgi:alkylation response protein AidB-like acyl-CoA dehydrogenase